jgi:regulatory protein
MRRKGARRAQNEETTDKPAREIPPERRRARTMERATRLLAARPRSVGELRARLLEKDWTDAETVEEVLARLAEYGYLDDEKFAQNYAAYQVRQKPTGRLRLKHELAQRKIAPEIAENALEEVFSEVSEAALLDEALAKRLCAKGRPTTPAEVQNLVAFLFRRGFSGELVWEKARAAARVEDE